MRPVSLRCARRALTTLGIAAAVVTAVAACSGSASPGGSAASSATVVVVSARDYAFDPSAVSVAPGPVTFRVANIGAEEHEFEVFRGDVVVDEVEGLVPGMTRDLTVTLETGEYTFVCKLADHEQRGMKGTLTVEQ